MGRIDDEPEDSGDRESTPRLARRLNLVLLTLYGLGTTIGAGIYALVGEVADRAGAAAPLAFLLAAAMASVSAIAFAELSARLPHSSGAALYIGHAFRRPRLSVLIGFMVIAAGCTSAAAVVNAFAGHLSPFFSLDRELAILAIVIALTAIAGWGILESVSAASLITVLEIGGVLAVVWATRSSLPQSATLVGDASSFLAAGGSAGVLAAGFLAFYAFLGFEDMVNVAEEVRDVRRVMPLSILLTLGITTVIYVAIAIAATVTVPVAELAASETPLVLVYERAGGRHARVLTFVALVAMLNGALIQLIMASRVLYGLASHGHITHRLARVHARTRTPLRATALAGSVVAVLALWLPLAPLAEATSILTLIVFTAVNAALWRIKLREPHATGALPIPVALPAFGVAFNLALLLARLCTSG
jgi:APA family basic amino acid/polyamine antiporter